MSLIKIQDVIVDNTLAKKAVPTIYLKQHIESTMMILRFQLGYRDGMQKDFETEELLFPRKRFRRQRPYLPIVEVQRTNKVKIPNYTGIWCYFKVLHADTNDRVRVLR